MTRAVIADDEPLMREQLRARLSELWPELEIVAEAKNGVEAVEQVAALRPEVVFLDIRMPAKTGIEAAREIAALDGRPPEIVFVTAYDQYAIDAFQQGVIDYVLKPAERERLGVTVDRLRKRPAALQNNPSLGSAQNQNENPRIPGQGDPAQVRRRDAPRRRLLFGRGGGEGDPRARRQSLGCKGADPRRRPRQGRRRESGEIRKRSARMGRKDPRHDAQDAPDRARRAESQKAARRRRRRHPKGALRRHGGGPRHAARGADGELRRRHGHRRSRGDNARKNPQGIRRSGDGSEGRRGRRHRGENWHPFRERAAGTNHAERAV